MGGEGLPRFDDILARIAKASRAVPGQGQAGLLAGQFEAFPRAERPVGIGLVFQEPPPLNSTSTRAASRSSPGFSPSAALSAPSCISRSTSTGASRGCKYACGRSLGPRPLGRPGLTALLGRPDRALYMALVAARGEGPGKGRRKQLLWKSDALGSRTPAPTAAWRWCVATARPLLAPREMTNDPSSCTRTSGSGHHRTILRAATAQLCPPCVELWRGHLNDRGTVGWDRSVRGASYQTVIVASRGLGQRRS